MAYRTITLLGQSSLVCGCEVEKCQHLWLADEKPKRCSHCKSPKWDVSGEIDSSEPGTPIRIYELESRVQFLESENHELMKERDQAHSQIAELEARPVTTKPRSQKSAEVKDGDTLNQHLCRHGMYKGTCRMC